MNHILVVRVGALGDTLMVTPTLRALRRQHPLAEIDVLCSESAAPLVDGNPHVSRVVRLRQRNVPYAVSLEKQHCVKALRARRYDLAILLERAPRYRGLLTRAAISDIRSFTESPFDPVQHCIVNYLRVAGIGDLEGDGLDMELHLSDAETDIARRLLRDLPQPRVGIQIGYGPRRGKKHQSQRLRGWNPEHVAQLIHDLLERGTSVVLTGSAEDRAETERLVQSLPRDRIRSLAGHTTVRELAAVIGSLDVFVSVDTGAAHIAAALGTPLVVLWGPAIYEQTRPVSSRSPVQIVRVPVPCAPCYGTPLMKSCTRNICMEGITPDAALGAVEDLLGREPRVIPLG
ncbi:MAG: glycosyltransferase family 9 protein [Acidobacteria bacterium]|nr:glycosyltransferase family 9 protein [Acidobacteriota bacterium]